LLSFKSFEADLSQVNDGNFDHIALKLFRFQAEHNLIYKKYLTYLGVNPKVIDSVNMIPFLPITFFKDNTVVTGDWKEEHTFLSSATSGQNQSRHLVYSLEHYLHNAERIFEQFYGPISNYHFFALLPSYLERQGSSLIAMVDYFIRRSQSPYSAFYLNSSKEFLDRLDALRRDKKKVLVLGVTFALLDLAEKMELDLGHCLVMETGGMKGRRKEITRDELHSFLSNRFNIKNVHSEYGMTELFSQAYAQTMGYFKCPAGMKVLIRDLNDPFCELVVDKVGGINVIDLSNIHTCAFVETQDLGKVRQDGSFEVLGRIDNSDIRGCNLLVG